MTKKSLTLTSPTSLPGLLLLLLFSNSFVALAQ